MTASFAPVPELLEGGLTMASLLAQLQALAWEHRSRGCDCCAQTIEQVLARLKEHLWLPTLTVNDSLPTCSVRKLPSTP